MDWVLAILVLQRKFVEKTDIFHKIINKRNMAVWNSKCQDLHKICGSNHLDYQQSQQSAQFIKIKYTKS
jgi:hypothetical protein